MIDDHPSTRRALERLLMTLGFAVSMFESAEAFLASDLHLPEACLLVDVHMPGMNGVELCKKLIDSGSNIPAILMTAHRDVATRVMVDRLHPIPTLLKPFDEDALLRAIEQATHTDR